MLTQSVHCRGFCFRSVFTCLVINSMLTQSVHSRGFCFRSVFTCPMVNSMLIPLCPVPWAQPLFCLHISINEPYVESAHYLWENSIDTGKSPSREFSPTILIAIWLWLASGQLVERRWIWDRFKMRGNIKHYDVKNDTSFRPGMVDTVVDV